MTTANPLTYVSEGMRAALAPGVGRVPARVCLVLLVSFLLAPTWLSIIGFRRRAIH